MIEPLSSCDDDDSEVEDERSRKFVSSWKSDYSWVVFDGEKCFDLSVRVRRRRIPLQQLEPVT